jgi:hypothetical protein
MSVIFKEKVYDQLLIFFNNLIIILLALFVLLIIFGLIKENMIDNLNNTLELLQEEELKYKSFLSAAKLEDPVKINDYNKYKILISLADYADQIIYNSLHLKKNKISLKAVSGEQHNIFALISALESDKKFTEVELVKLNQKDNYNFELEVLLEP